MSNAYPEQSADPTPMFEQAPGYVEFYFNHAQLGFTGFDIYGFLSETAHDAENRLIVRQKARITMAPKEAKLLAFYLANAVKKYELSFGPVSMAGEEDQSVASE